MDKTLMTSSLQHNFCVFKSSTCVIRTFKLAIPSRGDRTSDQQPTGILLRSCIQSLRHLSCRFGSMPTWVCTYQQLEGMRHKMNFALNT